MYVHIGLRLPSAASTKEPPRTEPTHAHTLTPMHARKCVQRQERTLCVFVRACGWVRACVGFAWRAFPFAAIAICNPSGSSPSHSEGSNPSRSA